MLCNLCKAAKKKKDEKAILIIIAYRLLLKDCMCTVIYFGSIFSCYDFDTSLEMKFLKKVKVKFLFIFNIVAL